MLHRLVRAVVVVGEGGPDAGDLVGGDARADPGAADENGALRLAQYDRGAGRPRDSGSHLAAVVAADVDDVVPVLPQQGEYPLP